MVPVRIKKLKPEAIIPAYQSEGAAGVDLHACIFDYVRIHQGYRKLIPTGIAIQLPPGYEAQIRPRSGLALKKGITVLNTPGTIDSDYRLELGVIIFNTNYEPFDIKPGDRIAQMVIAPVVTAQFIEVEELSDSERTGGFGSTGI